MHTFNLPYSVGDFQHCVPCNVSQISFVSHGTGVILGKSTTEDVIRNNKTCQTHTEKGLIKCDLKEFI